MVWGWEFLSLRRPSQQAVGTLLDAAPMGGFNHEHAGATHQAPPLPTRMIVDGWMLDHNRVQVGYGRLRFDRAVSLLEQWQQMHLGWVSTNAPKVKQGAKVCVSARSLFVWSRLPLEVVYVASQQAQLRPPPISSPVHRRLSPEDAFERVAADSAATSRVLLVAMASRPIRRGPCQRFCYATATTEGHQLQGEERFCVEHHESDDSVWYEIYTVSKPATPLARLTAPLVRFHQRQFGRCSMCKMVHDVAAADSGKT